MEPTTDDLDDILKELLASIPEVKAVAIVSSGGLPIASALPQGIDETRIAAMTASLHSLAKHAVIALKKGEYDQLTIKGSSGYLLVHRVNSNAVLIVSTTTEDVKLRRIFFDPYPQNYSDAGEV